MKEYDYILITSKYDKHYLQIGYIRYIPYYQDGDVNKYIVEFSDGIVEYDHRLEGSCSVLAFKQEV